MIDRPAVGPGRSEGTARRAIEAVARHVGAPWTGADAPLGTTLSVAGRTVAVTIATLPGKPSGGPKARLRDDRVARRVLADLEAAIGARATGGRTAILTLGAPIREPTRTVAPLTDTLVGHLAGGAVDLDEQMDVFGNRVRFRILGENASWTTRLVGFVFTGDPSPGALATAFSAVRDAIAAAATGQPSLAAGERWLVLTGGSWIADAPTYRRAISRLAIPDTFARIVMVDDRDRVEPLVG